MLSGAGTIFDAASLALVDTLANGVVDAVWPLDELIVSLALDEDDHYGRFWYDEASTTPRPHRLQLWGSGACRSPTVAREARCTANVERQVGIEKRISVRAGRRVTTSCRRSSTPSR